MKLCRIVILMIAIRLIANLSIFNRKISLNFKFFRFYDVKMKSKARSEKNIEESVKFPAKFESE